MNKNKSQKNYIKPKHTIDPNLSPEYQEAFKKGMEKKYPELFPVQSGKEGSKLANLLRKNLQSGLAKKYPQRFGHLVKKISNK